MERPNPGDDLFMDFPQDFRCPISMELMKDPVTISTGVTYDRKNIEKWFHVYNKRTCPATMQCIDTLDMTPNHTLTRLIAAWLDSRRPSDHSRPSGRPPPSSGELAAILDVIDSTPFKVSSLKKIRSIVEGGDGKIMEDFKRWGGVEVLVRIMVQVLVENYDFATIRACEEALGVLNQVPFSDDDEQILQLLMSPDCMKSMAIMLQRGSAEARFCAISTFIRIAKGDHNHHWSLVAQDQTIDFFKSLLETISDEICTKASSRALQLLIQILESSKKSRLKAIESGAICTLVELLPDSNGSRCERILRLLKLLCDCAEGRSAFIEHGLGIAAVSRKTMMTNGYDDDAAATRIGVKILWLVCRCQPTERVLEEMVVSGAVEKMVALLHMDGGGGGTKERVIRILKMHGGAWRRYPCFPTELRNYLGLGNDHSY